MSASIQFVGNVGKEPESQYTPSGAMVTKFSVAVNNGYGERATTTWFNCEFWGETLGELVKRFVGKGTKVFISGELRIREWRTSEGEVRTSNDVRVNQWELVSKRKQRDDIETPYDENPSDDRPDPQD